MIASIGKDVEKLEPCILLIGLQNGETTLEKQCGTIFQTFKRKVTISSNNMAPRYTSKKI
jgi:hypothetical protein